MFKQIHGMQKITLFLICFLVGGLLSNNFPVGSTPTSAIEEMSMEDYVIELVSTHSQNAFIPKPEREVLSHAVKGYVRLKDEGKIKNNRPLTVIDFTRPSSEKRMWIIDVEEGMILHHGYVSHGRNSGELMAQRFSNTSSSYMSSLGFYLTGEVYQGKHGYSLRLDGLEKGFNDKARERAIVIHGADYATEQVVKSSGRLGRSLGCPALPHAEARQVIDLIKDQSCLFIYGNDQEYLRKSSFLNS